LDIELKYPAAKKMAEPYTRLEAEFASFIEHTSFPCVGAKSALHQGGLYLLSARSLRSAWNDVALHQAIVQFAQAHGNAKRGFRSLAIIFAEPLHIGEAMFEQLLWQRLQSWTDKDVWLGYDGEPGVSSDPEDPRFSMSFGGHAFFAVGLHPRASRKARRFSRPTIILNLHQQFEKLRDEGKYAGMRKSILNRDRKLQGSINPMLSEFGTISEARQYSGRKVGADWHCPYHRSQNADIEEASL